MRGLLFDLDGTLLDTAPDFKACLNQLLLEEGKMPLGLESIKEVVSMGAKGLITLGFQINETSPDYDDLRDRLLMGYLKVLGQQTTFFPGIEKLITTLHETKIPWGIVTNKPERFTFPLLEVIPFPYKPSCVICADTLEHAKPHPLPITHACQQLNINPKRSMYVGDHLRDVQAGQAAGLSCCVVEYGYIHQNDNPLDWRANHYVRHADDILTVFEKEA